jgi:hypothetical protein
MSHNLEALSSHSVLKCAPLSNLYEGMTHVMPACRMDLWSAQLLSEPMLHINGPLAFWGSPEYTQ